MRKTDKIRLLNSLLQERDNLLSADEIKFLQSRPGFSMAAWNYSGLLFIHSGDTAETAATVCRIAKKCGCKAIQLRRSVIDYPEGYVKPEAPVYVPDPEEQPVITKVDSKDIDETPEAEVIQPEALPEHCPERKLKLSFPSVWSDLDDDNNMRIKNRFSKVSDAI